MHIISDQPAAAHPASARSGGEPALPTRYLAVEAGRIAYDDTGADDGGRLIVAIPGMGDLRSEYRKLRPALLQAGYRVVTMDVRGHGESSTVWRDFSAHAVGRDALALIAHLGADSAIILGTSFAAGAALWAAHDAPARVDGLVLFGPIVRDLPASWYAKLALRIGFAGPWRVGFWMMYWNSLFPKSTPADHQQAKAALAANLREPGRMHALRAMIACSKADTAAILAGSRVPALIVMGTADADFPDPAAEAQRLRAELRAQTLLIDGAGHYPHVELPEQVLPRLLAFLGALAVGQTRHS